MSPCPICGKAAARGAVVDAKRGVDAFPFCSFRCQMIDLGKWLDEDYRIPGESVDHAHGVLGGASSGVDDDAG